MKYSNSNTAPAEVLSQMILASNGKLKNGYKVLTYSFVPTPLGSMVAVADENALFLLEFIDRHRIERQLKSLKFKANACLVQGVTDPIKSISLELDSYFSGEITEFKTPVKLLGSEFQKSVWSELRATPYGQTRTYGAQSGAIGKPTACRALASANGANKLAIIIPCHRIVSSNGSLGGYAGGLERKQWLLDHEKKVLAR